MIHYLIKRLALSAVRGFELLMFARAIFSWFMQSGSSAIYDFLIMVTEPIIMPFRTLTSRIDFLRGFPLDVAYLLAFLCLELLLTFLMLL